MKDKISLFFFGPHSSHVAIYSGDKLVKAGECSIKRALEWLEYEIEITRTMDRSDLPGMTRPFPSTLTELKNMFEDVKKKDLEHQIRQHEEALMKLKQQATSGMPIAEKVAGKTSIGGGW